MKPTSPPCCPMRFPKPISKGVRAIKSGFVAVAGAPNAGKSTLINALMQNKMLITSAKPQTTRVHTRSILTGPDYQVILGDTPGLHTPRNKLGEFMLREAVREAENADLVLCLVDGTRPLLPALQHLPAGKPVVTALTKIDLLTPAELQMRREELGQKFQPLLAVSALTGENLDKLLSSLVELLPEGDYLYPEDQLMDCDLRFLAAELIREQALNRLEDEVPHGVAVEIERFDEEKDQVKIAATVMVEKESHKGIVIGRRGQMLKAIGTAARMEIEKLLQARVHLQLWVKVKKNWRKDANQLKWMGYK